MAITLPGHVRMRLALLRLLAIPIFKGRRLGSGAVRVGLEARRCPLRHGCRLDSTFPAQRHAAPKQEQSLSLYVSSEAVTVRECLSNFREFSVRFFRCLSSPQRRGHAPALFWISSFGATRATPTWANATQRGATTVEIRQRRLLIRCRSAYTPWEMSNGSARRPSAFEPRANCTYCTVLLHCKAVKEYRRFGVTGNRNPGSDTMASARATVAPGLIFRIVPAGSFVNKSSLRGTVLSRLGLFDLFFHPPLIQSCDKVRGRNKKNRGPSGA